MRIAPLCMMVAGLLLAQVPSALPRGTAPKAKATDYPVHAKVTGAEVGVEYMVRSFGEPGRLFVAEEYLIVEAAIFPTGRQPFPVDMRNFNLRVNGHDLLACQTPGIVAASLKYSDWSMRPRMTAEAGPIILGRPQSQSRFPGDNRPSRDRLPEPARTQTVDAENPSDPAAIAVTTALPEGPIRFPVSGFLYFHYQGKLNKIRSVELLVGDAILRLR